MFPSKRANFKSKLTIQMDQREPANVGTFEFLPTLHISSIAGARDRAADGACCVGGCRRPFFSTNNWRAT